MRFSRTLAVTPGHSKTGTEQARCPLTRSDEIAEAALRFPQLHEKSHSAVLSYLDTDRRRAFAATMRERDDVVWISNESPGVVPDLTAPEPSPAANAFLLGRNGHALAFTDPHGSWLDWLPTH